MCTAHLVPYETSKCHLLISIVYKTIELTIANHPVMKMSNFTIGPCLFYDQLIMKRKHTLDQYGTWTIFQLCTDSIIQFDARCGSSRSCTTDMLRPAISINATSPQGELETTSTQGKPETTSTQGEPETTSTRGNILMNMSKKIVNEG